MRVLITGSTGLIGSHLCAYLSAQGHTVGRLLRNRPVVGATSFEDHFWAPDTGELSSESIQGYEAIVHLAGAPIVGNRLSPKRKQLLYASRIDSTLLLAREIRKLSVAQRPKTLVCASAIGYYGYGYLPIDEMMPAGDGFLSKLCQKWEQAAATTTGLGLRVVSLRIGLVLSAKGGALRTLLRAQRLGIGAVLGSGQQYVSWIHIQDTLRLIEASLSRSSWQGAYNVTSPRPVTQRAFARTLAATCNQRLWLPPVPGWLLRAALGEVSELLLKGHQVLPSRAVAAHFVFQFKELKTALQDLLQTSRPTIVTTS